MQTEICFKTSIGYAKISVENNKIVKISFSESGKNIDSDNSVLEKCKNQLLEYFEGKRKVFDCEIEMKGTEFQKKVWKELYKVPYGQTISYKQLAEKIGKPTAYRAVANANRQNPVPVIYPCHRVIGSNGKLVGYAYGLDKKELLLKLEGVL
ncbi:MAG: methylated-DNA--[protein]-cysteine S-methyltransferase [Bacteroidales bacterium]|nr:methylated-DNA--[protein]-cysteine S-methyltransferase [Bacteroidales bacterium]